MNIFSFIKGHVSILDVVSHYTSLKKAGTYYKAPCPFHSEKTPSFTVSPHRDIFYCFGCHEAGDVISFVTKIENCSPVQAVQLLAERYNVEVPAELSRTASYESTDYDKKKQYLRICNFVARWAHEQLLHNKQAQAYLAERNITSESITCFRLGYFPGGLQQIRALIAQAKEESLLLDDLLEAHILVRGNSVIYSPFEQRILFPISDITNNICGFGGRIFMPNDQRPKYYNSKEHTYFAKGSLLFGLDCAKKAMHAQETVFLVEGYTDCIAMAQAGYTNTVATLGTACTLDHLKILARYVHQVYVVYDADKAGQEAVMRLAHLCWQVNLEFKIITLEPGYDPASHLREHKSLMLEKAHNIFSVVIERQTTDFVTQPLQKKMSAIASILELIGKLDDPIKRDILCKEAAMALQMPQATLTNALKQQQVRQTQPPQPTKPTQTKKTAEQRPTLALDDISRLEKKLFCAILKYGIQNDEDKTYLLTYFPAPLEPLLKKIIELQGQSGNTPPDVLDYVPESLKKVISTLMVEFHDSIDGEGYENLLAAFQKKHWKTYVQSVMHILGQAEQEGRLEDAERILHQFQHMKKKLMHKGLI